MRSFAPADEVLLFRQKDPKPSSNDAALAGALRFSAPGGVVERKIPRPPSTRGILACAPLGLYPPTRAMIGSIERSFLGPSIRPCSYEDLTSEI